MLENEGDNDLEAISYRVENIPSNVIKMCHSEDEFRLEYLFFTSTGQLYSLFPVLPPKMDLSEQ